jgi:hypothetical protein
MVHDPIKETTNLSAKSNARNVCGRRRIADTYLEHAEEHGASADSVTIASLLLVYDFGDDEIAVA